MIIKIEAHLNRFSLRFQFANQHSRYEPITFEFLAKNCGLPVRLPQSIAELVHLENIFDVMDIYLWLSYRFIDMFPHSEQVRSAQSQLDDLIQQGVAQITRLVKESTSVEMPEECNVYFGVIFRFKNLVSFFFIFSVRKLVVAEAETYQEKRTDAKERFSDYLIRKGVLSQKMMQQLQNEFLGQPEPHKLKENDSKKHIRRTKKRK